jgi:hypothetical protein
MMSLGLCLSPRAHHTFENLSIAAVPFVEKATRTRFGSKDLLHHIPQETQSLGGVKV